MGRPPIGRQAMSAAERQRRHRAKLRDSKPVTKPELPRTAEELIARMRQKAPRQAAPVRPIYQLPETEAVAKLERELKAARTRIKNQEDSLKVAWHIARKNGVFMTKANRRLIQSLLHPDTAPNNPKQQERLEKAFQLFTALKLVSDEPFNAA
jgi:hypothetical protein